MRLEDWYKYVEQLEKGQQEEASPEQQPAAPRRSHLQKLPRQVWPQSPPHRALLRFALLSGPKTRRQP